MARIELVFVFAGLAAAVAVGQDWGLRQSPIDIPVNSPLVLRGDKESLSFKYYSSIQSRYTVNNTGHGAQITLTNPLYHPRVRGGPLGPNWYMLQEVHFHWGKKNGEGSEHKLGGRTYSMEVHLVHYKKSYGSYERAKNQRDGLAVVAYFMEGYSAIKNSEFQKVVDLLPYIEEPGEMVKSETDLLGWVWRVLRPKGYYTYDGSLTTSPYSENVKWIVMEEAIPIGKVQVAAFRNLISNEDDLLLENFRGIQPLNGRVVAYVPE